MKLSLEILRHALLNLFHLFILYVACSYKAVKLNSLGKFSFKSTEIVTMVNRRFKMLELAVINCSLPQTCIKPPFQYDKLSSHEASQMLNTDFAGNVIGMSEGCYHQFTLQM